MQVKREKVLTSPFVFAPDQQSPSIQGLGGPASEHGVPALSLSVPLSLSEPLSLAKSLPVEDEDD